MMSKPFIGELYLKSYDALWRLRLKAIASQRWMVFSVFEAFSFLLDDGNADWLADKR